MASLIIPSALSVSISIFLDSFVYPFPFPPSQKQTNRHVAPTTFFLRAISARLPDSMPTSVAPSVGPMVLSLHPQRQRKAMIWSKSPKHSPVRFFLFFFFSFLDFLSVFSDTCRGLVLDPDETKTKKKSREQTLNFDRLFSCFLCLSFLPSAHSSFFFIVSCLAAMENRCTSYTRTALPSSFQLENLTSAMTTYSSRTATIISTSSTSAGTPTVGRQLRFGYTQFPLVLVSVGSLLLHFRFISY